MRIREEMSRDEISSHSPVSRSTGVPVVPSVAVQIACLLFGLVGFAVGSSGSFLCREKHKV